MSELQQCQNPPCNALESKVAELQAERSMLEGSVAHWKGQFNIAGEMVQDKKRLITDQAKEIERLRAACGEHLKTLHRELVNYDFNGSFEADVLASMAELKNALGDSK